MSFVCCADFAGDGETFGEEMYDAVGARLEEEPEVNGEDASDSPIENKFSPSIVPRYIVHVQTYEFQP